MYCSAIILLRGCRSPYVYIWGVAKYIRNQQWFLPLLIIFQGLNQLNGNGICFSQIQVTDCMFLLIEVPCEYPVGSMVALEEEGLQATVDISGSIKSNWSS